MAGPLQAQYKAMSDSGRDGAIPSTVKGLFLHQFRLQSLRSFFPLVPSPYLPLPAPLPHSVPFLSAASLQGRSRAKPRLTSLTFFLFFTVLKLPYILPYRFRANPFLPCYQPSRPFTRKVPCHSYIFSFLYCSQSPLHPFLPFSSKSGFSGLAVLPWWTVWRSILSFFEGGGGSRRRERSVIEVTNCREGREA